MGSTKRTTMRLTDERQRLLEQGKDIVAAGPRDEPPNSDVIDAALTHLVESQENFEKARDHLDPASIKRFDTSVISLQYQTSVDSCWR